jgi:hypothetical protein
MKEESCPICRESECDFETRCGHFYHKICLEMANEKNLIAFCPYCIRNISLNRKVEIVLKYPSKLKEELSKSPDILGKILKCSVLEGDLSVLSLLYSTGVDIHAENDEALRLSARNGYLDFVKYLVEHGADIHVKKDMAMELSATHGHLNIVKYLVE